MQCERASKRGGAVCIAREQRRSAIDFVKAEHVRRRHSCRCEWLIGWLPASGCRWPGGKNQGHRDRQAYSYNTGSAPHRPNLSELILFSLACASRSS